MAHLEDLFNIDDLDHMIDQGYVRTQVDPTASLQILNYTNKAQYDGEWNDVTEQTRGLIINSISKQVVARPFRKFFNWSQIPDLMQYWLLEEQAETTVKWDGSLGILYTLHTGEHAIATRGSFTSPQAQHATKVLHERYAAFEPLAGLTYLFEIIYPENRIVVNHGNKDDLVLIAVINTTSGKTLLPGPYGWLGPWNRPVGYQSMAEVLAVPQRENEEGFVVYFPGLDIRVKIKFDEYVRLHRILTNVSTISIWDALANGTGIDTIIDNVPDEFYEWVRKQVVDLTVAYDQIESDAKDEFEWIKKRVRRPEWDRAARKEFALLANTSPYKDVLFGLLDGKDIAPRIWKRLRPAYDKPFTAQNEDAA